MAWARELRPRAVFVSARRRLAVQVARRYRERCAEATSEGLPGRQVSGEPTGAHEQHPRLGKWEIPAPIADERAYREEVMKTRREME